MDYINLGAFVLGRESGVYHPQLSPLQWPAGGVEFGHAHVADAFEDFDGFATGTNCAAAGGAKGQG